MKKLGIVLIGLTALWSCKPDSPQAVSDNRRFVRVELLLDEQISWLEKQNPAVSKSITADEKQENRVLQIADWKKELEIFRQLDISKPGLQGLYTLTSPSPDVQLYTRKAGEKIPVEWLKVRFDTQGKPTHIDGKLRQKNYLYQSEKHLQLHLSQHSNEMPRLTGYEIEAEKKMLFSAPEHLVINTTIQ